MSGQTRQTKTQNPLYYGMEGVDNKLVLPPFHNVRLSSIAHIHIYVNESKYIYMSRFIISKWIWAMLESLILCNGGSNHDGVVHRFCEITWSGATERTSPVEIAHINNLIWCTHLMQKKKEKGIFSKVYSWYYI